MVELRTEWKPSKKLNVLGGALDFGAADPLPDGVSRDRIEEFCYAVRTLYGEYIDELTEGTDLSQREAQTWVLRNLVHEGSERFSYEAIGLYIWAIGRGTEGDPLSRTIVSTYHERAERKIEAAEETIKRTGPPPYPDDRFDEPTLLWVESAVADRLQSRTVPGETYNETIDRLLERTRTDLTVAELVDAYRAEGAIDYCAVKLLGDHWDDELTITVHAPTAIDAPEIVDAADAVLVDGVARPFSVEVTADPTALGSVVVVFDDRDEPGVGVEEGVDELAYALGAAELPLPALVERLDGENVSAIAVGNDPTAAGAHLYPIGGPDRNTPRVLRYLKRLSLDDRTVTVGATTPTTPADYEEMNETTLLWAREDGPLEARPLPDDPVDRRERIPTSVLRTA